MRYYFLCVCLFFTAQCFSVEDPLPSWNEGQVKQTLLRFVQDAVDQQGENYIPPKERIATFDQDGTLWVEQPLYPQVVFAIDMIKKLSVDHPEWEHQSPYREILNGNIKHMRQFSLQNIVKILAASHAGLTVTDFQKNVKEWLKTARHPRFNKLYTELVYQPMLELIHYLKKHEFKVYIVSGGGLDFMRTYTYKVYGIPDEHIVGTSDKTHYTYRNGEPVLVKLADVLLLDDHAGKAEGIHLFIGKHPTAAFGNSDGDQQMLEWSQASKEKNLQLLVHHDDPIREYAYDTKSKVGTFSTALKEEALKRKWLIVSMKNDWNTLFPDNKQ